MSRKRVLTCVLAVASVLGGWTACARAGTKAVIQLKNGGRFPAYVILFNDHEVRYQVGRRLLGGSASRIQSIETDLGIYTYDRRTGTFAFMAHDVPEEVVPRKAPRPEAAKPPAPRRSRTVNERAVVLFARGTQTRGLVTSLGPEGVHFLAGTRRYTYPANQVSAVATPSGIYVYSQDTGNFTYWTNRQAAAIAEGRYPLSHPATYAGRTSGEGAPSLSELDSEARAGEDVVVGVLALDVARMLRGTEFRASSAPATGRGSTSEKVKVFGHVRDLTGDLRRNQAFSLIYQETGANETPTIYTNAQGYYEYPVAKSWRITGVQFRTSLTERSVSKITFPRAHLGGGELDLVIPIK